jgi:hypothetical protein
MPRWTDEHDVWMLPEHVTADSETEHSTNASPLEVPTLHVLHFTEVHGTCDTLKRVEI